jgi:hypothetical protein
MNKYLLLIFFSTIFSFNLFSQNNSVLSNGNWYNITTNEDGIYKLDFSDFEALNINTSNLQIDAIKLYGNGGGMLPKLNSDFRYSDLTENAIKVHDSNENGVFENSDYILFYGMSPNIWSFNESTNLFEHETHLFSDEVSYFLTIDNQSNGKRIAEKNQLQNPTKLLTSFNSYSYHEEELENLIQSGNRWFGERFEFQNTYEFSFSFPNIIDNIESFISVNTAARSINPSIFNVDLNGSNIGSINTASVAAFGFEYAKSGSLNTSFISDSDDLNLKLAFIKQDNSALGWLDNIVINTRSSLKLSGDFFIFRDVDNLGDEIGRYKIENGANLEVWDITDHINPHKLVSSIIGNDLFFNDSLNILHEYIAFNSSAYLTPTLNGSVANQNLHNISNEVEFIIVCHHDFLSAANRLVNFHRENDNMISIVVTPQQIYNEFSSGMQDVSAIRDFVKYQHGKVDSNLKYLLLFGDGSYDPKNRTEDNTNFIITYQSDNSLEKQKSYVTDDYFGLLGEDEGLFSNDLVDIGIGRFPVSTISDANILVDKVENYYKYSTFGSWRNKVAFVADDGDALDGNTHMWQADSLANIVADNYTNINIQKVYLDNYYQESTPGGNRSPDAQNAISNIVTKGSFLVNYTGHGGELGWTNERILEVSQINNWSNSDNLPLFMTATCKFSYFDNPAEKSAGEYVLLNPEGGAIALLTTTRLVYSAPNYNLNTKFIKTVFSLDTITGQYPRLGDIFRTTKLLSGTSSNNRNFTLLGDPALRLAYPRFDVNTTSISDTLKALEEIMIDGQVEDKDMLLSNFNGTIYATIYDKEIIKTTLGQESCTPMPYRDQNNIIYKGAATVKDGKFSFSFIVPKDIAYNYGAGKISYYAVNDDEQNPLDANGNHDDFVIGGTADSIVYDYDEAELSLFMNDTLFIDGGITDENPIFLAHIFDLSGINTVGNGIGHDITAVLDGNTTDPFVLNDFYEANKDDFTRGIIKFPLRDLSEGKHSITLKVWDVFNNSSEATITFFVINENNFTIADFIAYPNPFLDHTNIYFQHNKVSEEIDYIIDIYSITGVLVKRIEQTSYNSEGYRIGPIKWDGKNNYGDKMSSGIYLANLGVTAKDGEFSSKSIRIILLP